MNGSQLYIVLQNHFRFIHYLVVVVTKIWFSSDIRAFYNFSIISVFDKNIFNRLYHDSVQQWIVDHFMCLLVYIYIYIYFIVSLSLKRCDDVYQNVPHCTIPVYLNQITGSTSGGFGRGKVGSCPYQNV